MYSLSTDFKLFYFISENISTYVRKLYYYVKNIWFSLLIIFDTCDVVYDCSISLYLIIYLIII